MSMRGIIQRAPAARRGLPVWWMTIAVFAVLIAYADGFWLTSLQGAVGAIERQQHSPVERWVRDSTLMLPLFFLAVLAAVLLARRLVGNGHGKVVQFATTALLITVLGTGVGVAEMAASSAYDYHLQTQHLLSEQHLGHSHLAAPAGSIVQPIAGGCTGLCASQRETFDVHVRAVSYGSFVLLITNVVLVAWVLALRSNRLWRRPVESPLSAPPVVSKELSLV
jgi:hypothetical protein